MTKLLQGFLKSQRPPGAGVVPASSAIHSARRTVVVDVEEVGTIGGLNVTGRTTTLGKPDGKG